MSIAQILLPEFDHETAKTRLFLERVPDLQAGWRPHPKSRTLGELSMHLATLPTWTRLTLKQTEHDTGTAALDPRLTSPFESCARTVAIHDAAVKAAREILADTTDGEMMAPWALKNCGKTLFTMPRSGVFRTFVLNHTIHHRGQLSVYLRMCDVTVPAIYGPTAEMELEKEAERNERF